MALPLVILVSNLWNTSQLILPPMHQLLVNGKVNIPPARPQPVPTGKPNVFAPVPTGRPNRHFSVPNDRGYSPSVVLRKHIEKVYTGYPRTIVDLIHQHTNDNVADLLTKALDGPRVFNSPMLYLLRVEMVINSPWIMPILGIQELASPKANGFCPEQTATGKDISNSFITVMICQKSLGYSNSPMIHVRRVGLVINPPGYIVPTGRIIVSTGRYIVPTARVIVATGRYVVPAGNALKLVLVGCVIPTGRIVIPGKSQIVIPG
nr:hypothetical protein [Tanacetum cinerariifolium]